ncbi:MAG: hypothetical protein JWM63_4239 [Gammaproteobacteria bacterium]|nr:hypothetical protein [Gammaproteobacteria bacterium]
MTPSIALRTWSPTTRPSASGICNHLASRLVLKGAGHAVRKVLPIADPPIGQRARCDIQYAIVLPEAGAHHGDENLPGDVFLVALVRNAHASLRFGRLEVREVALASLLVPWIGFRHV